MADYRGVDVAKSNPNQPCAVEGCTKPSRNRGWCSAHYERWRKTGTTELRTVEERFWAKVDKSAGPDGCWLWMGKGTSHGYGVFGSNYRQTGAHRVAYELCTGKPLGNNHVDHICFNRACVNPKHLRAVTQAQNNQNVREQRRTQSGIRGIRQTPAGTWTARVDQGNSSSLNRKVHYLGTFATREEAIAAVRRKRAEIFTHSDPEIA